MFQSSSSSSMAPLQQIKTQFHTSRLNTSRTSPNLFKLHPWEQGPLLLLANTTAGAISKDS